MIKSLLRASEIANDRNTLKLHSRHKKLTFTFATILFFFAILEIVLRIFGLGTLPIDSVFSDVYDINLQMLPNVENPWSVIKERLNNYGFRGAQVTKEKPQGVFRIIVVGDSTTFGAGVQTRETFAYVLQEILRGKNPNLQVINAGVPGTNLWQHRMMVEDLLMDFDPDILIVYTSPDLRLDHHALRKVHKQWFLRNRARGFLSKLQTYRFLRSILRPPHFEKNNHQFLDKGGQWLGWKEEFAEPTFEDLELLQKAAKKIGARLLLTPIIDRYSVEQAREKNLHKKDVQELNKLESVMIPFKLYAPMDELGIAYLRPFRDFVEGSYENNLFWDACHFTPAGHALMAHLLAAELQQSGWLQ